MRKGNKEGGKEGGREGRQTDKDKGKKDTMPELHKTTCLMMLPALVWRIRSSRPSPCLRLHKVAQDFVPPKTNKW